MKFELSAAATGGTTTGNRRNPELPVQPASANILRERRAQAHVVALNQSGARQQYISVCQNGPDVLSLFDDFPPVSGDVVGQIVFGGCAFENAARMRMTGERAPVLWVQGDVCPGNKMNGISAFAVAGQPVRRVKLADRMVGSAWADADADYCFLAGVLPAELSASRGGQTFSCFEQIEAALQTVGMDFSHVARTWFYLDDLLSWYGEFNVARTRFFHSRGVFDRLVPASTGIGAKNPAGAALTAGVLAVRPKDSRVRIQEVLSPLQCPAIDYRSSFSRAVEMAFPDHHTLMISGTASIAPGGKTVFADSTPRQMHLTLDVVEAILKSRAMTWQDTTRAIGYFHDLRALSIFEQCCRERGIPPLPLVPAHATVCRNDLWFELELDAMALNAAGSVFENSPAPLNLCAKKEGDRLIAFHEPPR